jgi:hypothetical protein
MTLDQLIALADNAYAGGSIDRVYAARKREVGVPFDADDLSVFIEKQLVEYFDEKAPWKSQLQRAANLMENAKYQLGDVQEAMEDAQLGEETEL